MLTVNFEDESSSEIKDKDPVSDGIPIAAIDVGHSAHEELEIFNQLWTEDLITGNPEEAIIVGDQSEVDVEVEDLIAEPPDWTEDLQELVDQMGFLRSKP